MSLHAGIHLRRGGLELDVDLEVADHQVLAVLGPNGAGKTTLLHALAGLQPIDRGRVTLAGQLVEDPADGIRLPADARRMGMVFQDHLLFPHLTATDNVSFGLRAAGLPRRQARKQALEWLSRMGLAGAAAAKPSQLSGGQCQRVALARALACRPRLLLLDEPLGALDIDARLSVRRELRAHLDTFAGPCLLVTHEPLEAIALADRLAILEDGRIVQQGQVEEVARRPRSAWAARLVGLNLYRGQARGTTIALASGATLTAASPHQGQVFAAIKPRAVALYRSRPEGSPRNVWRGTVDGLEASGDHIRIHVDGTIPIVADVTAAAVAELNLTRNTTVWTSVKATEVDVYPA